MYASSFFGLLFNLVCFGIVFYVIFLIAKGSSKKSKSHSRTSAQKYSGESMYSISSFIRYLEDMKNEGHKNISDVIKDLKEKSGHTEASVSKEVTSVKVMKESYKEEKMEDVNVSAKPKPHMDTSNLLLYLGAFVFLFAMFIFAAFTWDIYSAAFKVGLILLIPVLFFLVSLYLMKQEKFSTAAKVFQLISATTIAFAGVGIWNFVSFPAAITFWKYWLMYSAFALVSYVIFLSVLKEKRYRYFILGSIISSIVSIAYSYAPSSASRLAVIASLNISLYFGLNLFGVASDKILKNTVISVQRIIDIAIVLTAMATSIYVGNDAVIMAIALIVPWLFETYRALIEKDNSSKYFSLMLIVPKVFLLARAFSVTNVSLVVLVAALSMALQGAVEFGFNDDNLDLKRTSRLFHSIILSYITLIALPWDGFLRVGAGGSALFPDLSSLQILAVTTMSSIGLLFPVKSAKNPVYGVAMLPFLYGIFSVMPALATSYFMAIVAISIALVILFTKLEGEHEKFGIVNIAEVISVVAVFHLFRSGESFDLAMFIVPLIVTGVITITRRYRENTNYSVYAAPFIFLSSVGLSEYLSTKGFMLEFQSNWNLLAFLIPVFYYMVIAFVVKNKEHLINASWVMVLFSVLVTILTLMDASAVALIVIPFVMAGLWLYISKGETYGLSYLVGILLIAFLIHFGNQLNWKDVSIYLLLSGVAFILQAVIQNLAIEAKELVGVKSVLQAFAFWHLLAAIIWTLDSQGHAYYDRSLISAAQATYLTALGVLFSGGSLLVNKKDRWIRYIGGFSAVSSMWLFGALNHWELQFFIVPLTIYFGIIAFLTQKDGKNEESKSLEFLAIIIQGGTLLLQSVEGPESERIMYGILLIAFSLIITLVGNQYGRKTMYYLGLIFLVLELLIRLWVVIVIIPWWVYLAIVGVVLMGSGIYSVSKK